MKFEIKGLDDLKRKLDRLGDNARAIDGTHQVPFTELFPTAFMRAHSKLSSFEDLLRAGGFQGTPFKDIPDDEWDGVVRANTSFSDWEAMRGVAAKEWASARLMKGV